MAKFISIFNNKGGVGKTTITWNLADMLARKGKRVLLIDFDPQCNLSIAMLGSEQFKNFVSKAGSSQTIRSFLQGFLQNTGPGKAHVFTGPGTHANAHIVPGDFWLNVYSDALSVGGDLLTGNGLAKFTSLRALERQLKDEGHKYDYVLIDLPPSFGGLVRSALYSSDYIVIPCTSDTFSEYCIGLIGQMLPQFVSDWDTGNARYKQNNYGSKDYDDFGKPVFGGWIFNGFDKRDNKMLRADAAHFQNIGSAIKTLRETLKKEIKTYDACVAGPLKDLNLGQVEDMNVIIQNSLWQSIPASQLGLHSQVKDLTGGKANWSAAQLTTIGKLKTEISDLADNVIARL